ncbi:MAG: PBSX family phage terminase large subunit, partial [archaeon]|nr:PBSX family phage terminase large subunit [archaeon]
MVFSLGATSLTGADFLFNSNAFLNIAHGAVRSGKTIIATVRFLEHIRSSPYKYFLICGTTRDTIERNIINDLIGIIKNEHTYKYSKIDGKLIIDDKLIYLIGLNNEKVTDKIKGLTIGGAYIDEVTTVPRSAFDMVLTRCSLPNSKVFCTTNPDSPYHWLYTDYITNSSLLESGYVKTWKFLIEDNPHLSKEYINQMKHINSKSSAHYKRNILGEWAMAEGRVYEYFNEDNIISSSNIPARFDRLDIGCDYGVSAPNCFILIGTVFNETG